MEELFRAGRKVEYRKGTTILNAGDAPEGVIYLEKGYVRMYSISSDGVELTFNIFKPGSYLPVTWILLDEAIKYDFEAMTDVVLFRKNRDEVKDYLLKNPKELMDLTIKIVSGLNGLVARMESIFIGNAAQRVIYVIVNSAKRFGKRNDQGEIVIDLPLSHRDIANMAGLTRETTSLEMKKLDKRKLICYKRRYVVVYDLAKLEQEL